MHNLARKVAVASVSVATVLSMSGAAVMVPTAAADTISDLQAQIASLQAQLAALTGGGSGGACFSFTRDLTLNSQGADVTALQDYLTGTGHFTFSGGSTGFFGPITQSAVAAWQAANGVSPAAGYWGPISMGVYNGLCGTSSGSNGASSGSDSALSGGAGSADYKLVSDLSSEEVGEDEADQDVAGLEIEARGSDIEVMAARLVFVHSSSGAGSDDDFDKYADEVAISLDGEELARVDADEFNDDNTYSATVSLDSGGVVEEDEKGELVVAVTGTSNLDSNNVGETWTVDFRTVRYRDAQGSSVSEDPGTATRTFSFESFATAAGSELRISEADNDAVNKAHLVNVHATEKTDGAVILDFELENVGSSDFEYREFGVNFDVTGAGHVDDVIAGGSTPQAFLYLDGQSYGTASYQDDADGVDVGTDEDVLWDDVDFTHPAGETISGQVKLNLLPLDDDIDLGDTIVATLGETETDQAALVDVRDDSGTQLGDIDITGSATGEASEIRDVGFDLALVGTPTAVKSIGNASTGTSDSGLFTITFDITAWDGDIFVDKTAPDDAGGATESDLNVTGTGTLTATITSPSGATEGTNAFQVSEDETERFTITADVRDGAVDLVDGFHDVSLGSILYALTDVDGDLVHNFNLGDFKTPQIFLDDLE